MDALQNLFLEATVDQLQKKVQVVLALQVFQNVWYKEDTCVKQWLKRWPCLCVCKKLTEFVQIFRNKDRL